MMVSVIIPIYNAEKYLKECLDSLERQDCDLYEVILVDDGSSDNSGVICNSFVDRNKKFSYYKKENGGSNSARLFGLEQAHGQYILFVDADDWVDANYISTFCDDILSDSKIQHVIGGLLYDAKKSIKTLPNFKQGIYDKMDIKNEIIPNMFYKGPIEGWGFPPQLAGKLYNRDLLLIEMRKMDMKIIYGEDVGFWMPLFLKAERISVKHYAGYHYRLSHQSVNSRYNPALFESNLCLYRHLDSEIRNAGFNSILHDQLELYMFYIMDYALDNCFSFKNKIMKHVRLTEENMCGELIGIWKLPIDLIEDKKILLYGAGSVGRSYYWQLKEIYNQHLVSWIDSNEELCAKEVRLESIDVGLGKEYDFVLIAVKSEEDANAIRDKLEKLGVQPNKIIWEEPVYKCTIQVMKEKV